MKRLPLPIRGAAHEVVEIHPIQLQQGFVRQVGTLLHVRSEIISDHAENAEELTKQKRQIESWIEVIECL